jgi:mycothiol system anti-sigma-R factor
MTCQEALSLLYDVIDKEASEIDVRQVQTHLKQCCHCAEKYKIEAAVNELLREKMCHQNPPSKLESLKQRVLDQLNAVDGEDDSAGGNSRKKKIC